MNYRLAPVNLLVLWIVETPLLYYLSMPVCGALRQFDYFLCAYPAIILEQLLLGGRIRWFNPFTVTTYTITAAQLLAPRDQFERRSTRD